MIEYLNVILAAGTFVVGLLTVVNGWLVFALNSYRRNIDELRRKESDNSERIAAIRELVAGQYVTQARFESGMRDQRDALRDDLKQQTEALLAALKVAGK